MEFDRSERRRFSLQKGPLWRDKWTVQKRRFGWFEHLPGGWWVKLFLSKASSSRSCASSIMHGQDKDCTGGFQRHGAVTQSHSIQLQPAERMMPLAPLFPPAICLIITGSRSTGFGRTVGSSPAIKRGGRRKERRGLCPELLRNFWFLGWMLRGATPGCCCCCCQCRYWRSWQRRWGLTFHQNTHWKHRENVGTFLHFCFSLDP